MSKLQGEKIVSLAVRDAVKPRGVLGIGRGLDDPRSCELADDGTPHARWRRVAPWRSYPSMRSAVHAQSIMRSPSLNVGAAHPEHQSDDNAADRSGPRRQNVAEPPDPSGLWLRLSRRRRRVSRISRSLRRRSLRLTVPAAAGASGKGKNSGPRRNVSQVAGSTALTVANEIVAEIDGTLTDAQADELARRHGLARLQSQNFPLIGATIGLFRITDRRSVETVSREFAADAGVRSVQPNFRYVLQDQKAAPTEGDPAQYALAKAPAARGAHAGARRQHHRRRDRFRHRCQASGTRGCDCGQLRCARQQGRSACPRHRRCRRDRGACAADGKRAGGADSGDPRFQHTRQRARKARPSCCSRGSTTPPRMARRSSI